MARASSESQDLMKEFSKLGFKTFTAHDATTEIISSGVPPLDVALGGGFPTGRIIEVYGWESHGKSTLAYLMLAEVLKKGGVGVLFDREGAAYKIWLEKLGINTDELLIKVPRDVEEFFDQLNSLVDLSRSSGRLIGVALDSIAALPSKAEVDGKEGLASHARAISAGFRSLKIEEFSNSRMVLLLTNQVRTAVGVMFGDPTVTAGGNALKFYASVRLKVKAAPLLDEKIRIGVDVYITTTKTRLTAPYRMVVARIYFDYGLDEAASVYKSLAENKFLESTGSWHRLILPDGKELKMQGMNKWEEIYFANKEQLLQVLKDKLFAPRYVPPDTELTRIEVEDVEEEEIPLAPGFERSSGESERTPL